MSDKLTPYERHFSPEVQSDLTSLRKINETERDLQRETARKLEHDKNDKELRWLAGSILGAAGRLVGDAKELEFTTDQGDQIKITNRHTSRRKYEPHETIDIDIRVNPDNPNLDPFTRQLITAHPDGIHIDVYHERSDYYCAEVAGTHIWANKLAEYEPLLTTLRDSLQSREKKQQHE